METLVLTVTTGTLSLLRNILVLGTSLLVMHASSLVVIIATDTTTGKPLLTTEAFPYDLDTTSLGLMATKREQAVIQSVMDEMLEYVNADGIIQVTIV